MTYDEILIEIKKELDTMEQKLLGIGQLYAAPTYPHCVFCCGPQQLVPYLGQHICLRCLCNINSLAAPTHPHS